MTKKELKAYQATRGNWGNINPITRVVEDKTKYNRKRDKRKWQKLAKEAENN